MNPAFYPEVTYEALNVLIGSNTATYAHPMLGLVLHLGQGNIQYTPATPLATLQAAEATFSGYSADTVTWNAPDLSSGGFYEAVSNPATWRPTGSATTNQIYGYWGVLPGSGSAAFCAPFNGAPINMASALDLISLTLRVQLAPSGVSVEIN